MIFDSLYKFHAVNDNSMSALKNKNIWFSTQHSLNDPFEGIIKTIYPKSESERVAKSIRYAISMRLDEGISDRVKAEEFVLERYMENPEEFLNTVRQQAENKHYNEIEYTKSCGIYSTSSDIPGDNRSHVANMLMWSLYADGFSGFCIKYDAKKLYKSLVDLNTDDSFAYAKVNYVTKPHEVDIYSLVHKRKLDCLKAIQFKHEQWGHECECRIVSNTTGLKRIDPESFEAVYFGDKISEKNQHDLIEIIEASYPSADIFRVKLDTESYGVRIGKKM
ncbi:TPA: DUF2971 domain-containing protein [Aeromonas sobria]|nr:DUF2971 domain-containing protein [Aeromonas sobria]